MIDTTLSNLIVQSGLDDKEAKAYLALLEIGQGTAAEIAKKAGLKRSIAYHVLGRLKDLGFATELPNLKIREFASTDPEKLFSKLKNTVNSLKEMMPYIKALQNKGRNRPRFEYFEGKEAIASVYLQLEKAKKARYMSSMQRLMKFFPEEVKHWINGFKNDTFGQRAKNLLSDTPEDLAISKELNGFPQEARFLPKGINIEMDFAITDNMLAITSFDPLFVVVIYSDKIADAAGGLFDLAWKQGRRIK